MSSLYVLYIYSNRTSLSYVIKRDQRDKTKETLYRTFILLPCAFLLAVVSEELVFLSLSALFPFLGHIYICWKFSPLFPSFYFPTVLDVGGRKCRKVRKENDIGCSTSAPLTRVVTLPTENSAFAIGISLAPSHRGCLASVFNPNIDLLVYNI